MHEVHLVRAIVDTVEKQATVRGAKRVKLTKIRFDPLTSHSGEFTFDIVKKENDLVKDARCALTQIAPLLRCAKCGYQFESDHLPDICPKCDSLGLKAVNPTDMVLEGFEIEK